MEVDMQRNFQKQRENNLVFSGIPAGISDDALENTVINIAQALKCPVVSDDLQACHRLPSKNKNNINTIVKFVNRKDAEMIMKNRSKLKNIETKSFGEQFSGEEKIYINHNLTPYYSSLAWKCRQLKRRELISVIKVSSTSIKIARGESTTMHKIESDDDLSYIFSIEELDSLHEYNWFVIMFFLVILCTRVFCYHLVLDNLHLFSLNYLK